MVTKITILGQSKVEENKLKPIEFIKTIEHNGSNFDTVTKPRDCVEIILLAKNYQNTNMDLFFVPSFYDNPKGNHLYLGHFNDGVIE